jgi:hypothetical protein
VKNGLWFITAAVAALLVISFAAAPGAGEDFYGRLAVGAPVVHGNLAVYPVTLAGGGEKLGEVLTLDEAMAGGDFKITEMEEGAEVNTLQVVNNTGKHVILLAGEIVRGAKQDRIISHDVVIPPGVKTGVDAFCVEAGRWTEVSDEFAYNKEIAPASIRGTAQGHKDQGMVWAEVSTVNADLGAATATDTLTASYDAAAFRAEAAEYEKAFAAAAAGPDVVGVIVVTADGRAGDVFANHELFAKVWPRLLTSYAMDGVTAGELAATPSTAEMQAYLSQLDDAEEEEVFDDGSQNRRELKKGAMNAYELEFEDSKVHLNIY